MEDVSGLFEKGGAVMWPIVALSSLGLAIAFERFIAFARFFRGGDTRPGESPQRRLNRLQRGFGLLSTIITAEPMLGILGTVTGIIRTFAAFDAASGSPVAATAGIGEALITTAAGLVAALVLIFPYNALLGLLSRAAERLEEQDEEETP